MVTLEVKFDKASEPKFEGVTRTVCRAINPKSAKFFPISSHLGETIFDVEKLQAFSKAEIITESSCTEEIIASREYAYLYSDFGQRFSADAGLKSEVGLALSASFATEFAVSVETEARSKFCQVYKIAKIGKLILPSYKTRHAKLRELLTKDFREEIDSVSSSEKAETIIRNWGGLYIAEADFGAKLWLTSSSCSSSFSTVESFTTALKEELSALGIGGAAVAGCFSSSPRASTTRADLWYSMASEGGDSGILLGGDKSKWAESASARPSVVDVKLAPIYFLAEEKSEARGHLEAGFKSWITAASLRIPFLRWSPSCLDGKTFKIRSMHAPGKVLGIHKRSVENGGEVKLEEQSKANSQEWMIKFNPDDKTVSFFVSHSKKALDIKYKKKENGAILHQWEPLTEDSDSQRWVIEGAQIEGDGIIITKIKSKLAGKYIDLDAKGTEVGTRAHLWSFDDSSSQLFRLEPTGK